MTLKIRNAAVLANTQHPSARALLRRCLAALRELGVGPLLDADTARLLPKESAPRMPLDLAVAQAQVVVTLGGDGTLLKACQPAAPLGRPLLGINLGRRGYLTAHGPEYLEAALAAAVQGRLTQMRLCMLEARVMHRGRLVTKRLALNDMVLARGSWGRLAALEVRLDGHPLTHYLADGLIVATPTGSTAYALAAGGPLLEPGLPCLALVPIAPHTLSHRPLVIASSSKIELNIPATAKNLGLSADGLPPVRLAAGDKVQVARSRFQALLLMPRGHDWRETLRDKLDWRGY